MPSIQFWPEPYLCSIYGVHVCMIYICTAYIWCLCVYDICLHRVPYRLKFSPQPQKYIIVSHSRINPAPWKYLIYTNPAQGFLPDRLQNTPTIPVFQSRTPKINRYISCVQSPRRAKNDIFARLYEVCTVYMVFMCIWCIYGVGIDGKRSRLTPVSLVLVLQLVRLNTKILTRPCVPCVCVAACKAGHIDTDPPLCPLCLCCSL